MEDEEAIAALHESKDEFDEPRYPLLLTVFGIWLIPILVVAVVLIVTAGCSSTRTEEAAPCVRR